jgi:hypothetical protein
VWPLGHSTTRPQDAVVLASEADATAACRLAQADNEAGFMTGSPARDIDVSKPLRNHASLTEQDPTNKIAKVEDDAKAT